MNLLEDLNSEETEERLIQKSGNRIKLFIFVLKMTYTAIKEISFWYCVMFIALKF
jgi:hypothetical protein